MTVVRKLLPVVGQNLRAGVAQPGPVLLQARQHDLVAIIHLSAAKPRDIPRAGVMPLLRRRRRGHQNKRHDENNSGHLLCLQISRTRSNSGAARAIQNLKPFETARRTVVRSNRHRNGFCFCTCAGRPAPGKRAAVKPMTPRPVISPGPSPSPPCDPMRGQAIASEAHERGPMMPSGTNPWSR